MTVLAWLSVRLGRDGREMQVAKVRYWDESNNYWVADGGHIATVLTDDGSGTLLRNLEVEALMPSHLR